MVQNAFIVVLKPPLFAKDCGFTHRLGKQFQPFLASRSLHLQTECHDTAPLGGDQRRKGNSCPQVDLTIGNRGTADGWAERYLSEFLPVFGIKCIKKATRIIGDLEVDNSIGNCYTT